MTRNIRQNLIRYNLLYRAGTPEVNDQEYDTLLDTFKNEVSEEEYNEFREKLFEAPGKVKHPYIMGSLEKTKADEGDDSLVKWLIKNNITDLFCSTKIDGLSVRLEYKNGVLVDAVTRGDGEYGESIYNKALHFTQSQILSEQFTGHIRGEIVLTKDNFVKLCEMDNKEYKNSRTSAVGLVNSKDFNVNAIKLLKVITYEIIGENSTKIEQYNHLSSMGFETAQFFVLSLTDLDVVKYTLLKKFKEYLDKCEYDIDGLVLTSEFNSTFENERLPKKTVAFKTNLLTKGTTLIDVEWNISKSGFYKPVAIIDPVELGGAMIGRASLYNYQWIKDRNICYNAKVEVLKSGDIIPRIMEIDNSNCTKLLDIPEYCECCNTKLVEDGVELRCPNNQCSAQTLLKVSQFIRRLGIEDASTKTLVNFGINTFEDLLNWRPDTSYRSQEKLYKEITKKIFNVKKEKIFTALDYDGIGERTVNKFIEHFGFDTILTGFEYYIKYNASLLNYNYDALLPEGIGEITLKTFLNALDDNIKIYNMFILDSRYNEPECIQSVSSTANTLNGKSYCFTGKLNTMSRSDAEKKVIDNGGKIGGVNKTLTYLVTNDTDSGSSKNKKASALGVQVISEEEFLKHVSENNGDINAL
jgi:DNA ligase (NAD+)